jgi:sialate O-acetylesterase
MKKLSIRRFATSLILIILSICGQGNVRLPVLGSDGMVLQRDSKINIRGWGSPWEKMRIRFDNKTLSTATDPYGNRIIALPPMKAGWPYSMEVQYLPSESQWAEL